MNKSKNQENQIHKKWLRKGLIFFKMQNFAQFLLFIIHRIMNSKFDAFLQPVVKKKGNTMNRMKKKEEKEKKKEKREKKKKEHEEKEKTLISDYPGNWRPAVQISFFSIQPQLQATQLSRDGKAESLDGETARNDALDRLLVVVVGNNAGFHGNAGRSGGSGARWKAFHSFRQRQTKW